MQRLLAVITAILIALGVLAAAHYYIWARLVRDVGWSDNSRRWLTAVVIGLGLSIPASFVLARQLPPRHGTWVLYAIYIWMGSLLTFMLTLGIGDLIRFVLEHFGPGHTLLAQQPERRQFLKRALAAAATLFTGSSAAVAINEAVSEVEVLDVRVSLKRLPASLHGFTIAQISDLHLGPTLREDFIRHIVDRVNALDADLVAITGDLVDGSVERLRKIVAPIANLRARHGVFFVTGNHEYYSGVDEWIAEIRRLGITVLRNERVSIGSAQASFDLVGVDDAHAHQFGNGHGEDVPRAVQGRDPNREAVLLAHQPRTIFTAAEHGIGLQLSGHTHGGQIWPFGYLVRLQQPVVKGLAKIGSVWLYVNSGTGYWGPPMRLGAPPEITRVILQSELASSEGASSAKNSHVPS
jgi:uncharacterized protein